MAKFSLRGVEGTAARLDVSFFGLRDLDLVEFRTGRRQTVRFAGVNIDRCCSSIGRILPAWLGSVLKASSLLAVRGSGFAREG